MYGASMKSRFVLALAVALAISIAGGLDAKSTPPHACSGVPVDVKGDGAPGTEAAVCRAASTVVQLLGECGLNLKDRVRVEVVAGRLDHCGLSVFGTFDPEARQVRVSSPEICKGLVKADSIFSKVPTEAVFESIVVHELAHAIVTARRPDKPISRAAQEYIAYAMQIRSLPEGDRAALLKGPPQEAVTDISVFNDMVLFMNPDAFAVLAYSHFSEPANGCRFVKGLADGAIKFPPIEDLQ